ncbi:MAG: hypothetical protein GX410_11375 [Elusimicrobia bacterium]|nr:hypothetical protein [Elusimicrobiota bacterium]
MENSPPILIRKGSILVYRAYDVSEEINLSSAEKLLLSYGEAGRLRLVTDLRKAIIIKEAPIVVELPGEKLELGGRPIETAVTAKVWDYGVISITLKFQIPPATDWKGLVDLAWLMENSPQLDKLAQDRKQLLLTQLLPAAKNLYSWTVAEDYITYCIEGYEGAASPRELLNKADIAALILAENKDKLSEQSRELILKHALQYSASDIAVIDWNSALLIDNEMPRDIADTIEFCLTHLLVMRHYDEMLDRKLSALYDSMENRGKQGFLRRLLDDFYSRMEEETAQKYIEFSEFLTRVENSLKTVGDSYLATIFRMAGHEFRFKDWQGSVDRKMSTLERITQILQGEINSRRSHWLEIIVIGLIALELIPLLDHFTK